MKRPEVRLSVPVRGKGSSFGPLASAAVTGNFASGPASCLDNFIESLEAVGNVLGATVHIHKTNSHYSLSYREPEFGQTHQANDIPQTSDESNAIKEAGTLQGWRK
jgi:hypothetical protein